MSGDYSAYGMTELLYEAADTSALLGDAVQSSKADALLSVQRDHVRAGVAYRGIEATASRRSRG